jgi:hypothetical protein
MHAAGIEPIIGREELAHWITILNYGEPPTVEDMSDVVRRPGHQPGPPHTHTQSIIVHS